MEDDLVAWGRVLRISTRGRVTGRPAAAAIGYVERPGGTLLVAAGDPDADWALNLRAHAEAQVTIAERTIPVRARELDGPERAAAIRELIVRYGTPAERLGAGPAFALEPVAGR